MSAESVTYILRLHQHCIAGKEADDRRQPFVQVKLGKSQRRL